MTTNFKQYLLGGDLRSIAGSNEVVGLVKTQTDFDNLFSFLHEKDRLVVMRAADAVEKISFAHPEYLAPHIDSIVMLCSTAKHKELKWHLALLAPRIALNTLQKDTIVKILQTWVGDRCESAIVRVNSLQALFDMGYFRNITRGDENLPASLKARIKKLESRLG